MRYRNPKKESDLFSMIEHQQSVQKAVKGINLQNDPDGDGPFANHRPDPGRAT